MALDQTTEAFLKGLAEQEGPAFHELPPENAENCLPAYASASKATW